MVGYMLATSILISSALAQTSRVAQFNDFQTDFNKLYTPTDTERKLQIFSQSMDRIAQRNRENAANGGGAVFGVTRFSDLTPEEFRAKYLTYTPRPRTTTSSSSTSSSTSGTTRVAPLATSVLASLDWRNVNGVNYMTPVKDQGACGSCWAFSAAQTLESYQKLAGVYSQPLSPQQIASCDTASYGCGGGWTETAFDYLIKYGATSEAAYPYTSGNAVLAQCKSASLTPPTTSVRRLLALTRAPTAKPTTKSPTPKPTTKAPVPKPTTKSPTLKPTRPPTNQPTTKAPVVKPTTKSPTPKPTTKAPVFKPTTKSPTQKPTTRTPTMSLSFSFTARPTTKAPSTARPSTIAPSKAPTKAPTTLPPSTSAPISRAPTSSPPSTNPPTKTPTNAPTKTPTKAPTTLPPSTKAPTKAPTVQGFPIIARMTSWEYVDHGEDNLKKALQPPPSNPNGGPVSVCLAADALQDYTGGILQTCDGNVNHCLQAAGYGTENGVSYWLLRNQWGTGWGEAGYVRVAMGRNLCQLSTDSMIYPVGASA